MKRSLLSILLALCLLTSLFTAGAWADQSYGDGLCPHCTEQTEACGCLTAREGAPCSHEHTEDCFALAGECTHEHDEACGYTEPVEDAACGFSCEICAELTEETEATEGEEDTLDISTPLDEVDTPAVAAEEVPEEDEPAPAAENSVQYHLNQQMIPGVSGDSAEWYASETIAELADISKFNIKNGQYASNGTIYYFAGWHTSKLTAFTSYADIAYPVMVPGASERTLNVSYPTDEITPNSDGDRKLYAVWAPASSRFMFGYAMMLPGATFPGVNLDSYDADTWYTSDGQRLGNNGLGSTGFQKFTILDEGHNDGVDENPLTVTADIPTAAGSDYADYTFVAWFNKTPGSTYRKYVLQGGDDVTYSGTNVYSLDAVWGLVNGAKNVSTSYDGQGHQIDIDALTTSFQRGSYSSDAAKATVNAYFANDDSLSSGGTAKNDNLAYYVTVTYNGTEAVPEKELTSASDLPKFSAVGTYVYTITAKLKKIDPTNGLDPNAEKVTITVDSDTATLTILPVLTFDAALDISPSWDDLEGTETFTFTLSSESFGSITATVDQSSHSVTFDKQFAFSEADIGKTFRFTVAQTAGNLSYIAYDTAPRTVSVSIVKDRVGNITLEFTGDGTVGNTGGNTYSCTLAFENRIIGVLTVSKTVTGAAGDTDKAFTFQVELSDTTVNGTYGGMTFTNGVAAFTLKHGESKTAARLPSGVAYTVTEAEADQDGYSTTSVNASGTIQVNQSVAVEFINNKDGSDPVPTPAPTQEPLGTAPPTGDESSIALWTSLALLSLAGMIITLSAQKKIKK